MQRIKHLRWLRQALWTSHTILETVQLTQSQILTKKHRALRYVNCIIMCCDVRTIPLSSGHVKNHLLEETIEYLYYTGPSATSRKRTGTLRLLLLFHELLWCLFALFTSESKQQGNADFCTRLLAAIAGTMQPSCLSDVMKGVDHSMWTNANSAPITLRTVGPTSAVISDVGELIALCEQARCGVDGKTVTDLSVRKTLRVAADRVSVEWPALSAAAEDCAAHLGLGAGVTAELHDVLVYRPGDFFKRHVDSIKHPQHRATLVVDTGLPLEPFVGGVLHVGDTPWVSCGAGSYAAWHTNAEHHVTELMSGHRVVAMYNLLQSEPVSQRAAGRDVDEAEVAVLVEHLKRNAATYVRRFSEEVIANADDLFATYAAERLQRRDPVETSAPHQPWSPWIEQSWNCYKGKREFVGFWLMRQYVSDEGVVRSANLNGADADLRAAVAQEFGVPLAHIECRVVCHYRDGEYRGGGTVYADYECPKGSVYVGGGVISKYHDYEEHESMYGDKFRYVVVVGGNRMAAREGDGLSIGNDAGDPIFRYRETYLYFHVKYLKDYLTRESSTRGCVTAPCDTMNPGGLLGVQSAVDVLATHLRENAASYATEFSDEEMDYADERFLTWSSRLSVAVPANTNWNATYHHHWRRHNNIPQEFVGFWLTNLQYRSYNGRILRSSLCGADAELVAAVARTFNVPLEHIECREMHFGCTAEEFADPPCDWSFDNNECWHRKSYGDMLGAVLVDSDVYDSFDEDSVEIVGGCYSVESRYNGLSDYEASRDSSRRGQAYIDRATYLYFHVKYLKDYLRKNTRAV